MRMAGKCVTMMGNYIRNYFPFYLIELQYKQADPLWRTW